MVSKPIDLKCQEVVELVTDYLVGALSVDQRVRVEKHLLVCPPCTTYLDQMKTTVELTRGLDGAPAEEIAADLMALFRRRQPR